jgi:hypothetical protein
MLHTTLRLIYMHACMHTCIAIWTFQLLVVMVQGLSLAVRWVLSGAFLTGM